MALTPETGTGTGRAASAQSNMAHARSALIAALFLVCAATAISGVSAFVAPTSHVGVGVVLSNQQQQQQQQQQPRTTGTGPDSDTRLQLSTFGGGNRNNNDGEGYSTSNVNDAYVRSTQSSTYRPLFNGGTNSVELPTSGNGNGRTRGNGRNGRNGNSSNNNNFGNTYNANGRTQQRKRNSSSSNRGGAGGGLANLFNFGNQSNKNNYNARQNQQQRYNQPAATYRNTNTNGNVNGGFGGTGNRRTSNFSNRISDGGGGYTGSTGGGPSLSVARLFRQQQKQQRQQLQRTGRYTYNNANSNRQFQSLTNNRRAGTSTGRLSDIGKAQANRQLMSRNRAAEQAAQRRLRQAQSGTSNNGFNNRFQSNALGNTFQGAGLGGSSTRRAGVRLSDVGKANADREQQRRQREAERRQRAERQGLEKQKRDQRLKEERERKRRRAEQQRREREQNQFTRQQKLEQQRRERQSRSLATYGGGSNNRGAGGSNSKLFDYDQNGRKRYRGWTAPLSIEGLFGGRNSIGSGVLNNSYKAKLNARSGYGDGNSNYYKYSTATSPSSANTPNINTAAALVNSASFSAGRNSGGFNAQGSRSGNNNRVRLSDVGKYDDSNRRGAGRSVRLSDVGKAPSYNAFDRFSNDNRALSWQDRMDRTFYRGDGVSRRSSTSGRYYDSYGYGNEYGTGNKNVWGGRWREPRRDIDRRDGVIDVDYTTNEGRSAYGRQRRGPNVLRKLSKTIVDSGAKMRIMNEIKKLERQMKNRKSRFNAEVYDIMAEIDNEYSRYGRGSLDDREMEMMDREKDSRTRRAYDKARRDIDIIQDRIDRLREELFDLEGAMSETWDRRDDDFRNDDSLRRSLPPARRDDYYGRQRRRSSDRFSLPPSDGSRIRLSDIERDERRMPVGRSRYDDYERRDPEENRMRREGEEEEEERQRRVQNEMIRRQDEMQMMEDERRRRQQEEEENIRFQQQRQQEEEEMYRMQQARQEQEEREMKMYNSGDGYRREEYDRMAGQQWQQQQQQQQPPRPQDEATWTRDDELRAVNDPYRRVDPSGRPSESGQGGMQGQTSTTRRVDDRYGNSVGQW